jgi:hypothetical protein
LSAGASSSTPTVPHAIAAALSAPIGSPMNTSPNSATWMISVFEYATPSAKLRSAITRSSSAVATICATAPITTHAANAAVGAGSA